MTEDLQGLLEKINRDGVAKADAEAAKIIAAAQEKAARIVADAERDAASKRESAERDAADYARRAAETVRQAERDTVLAVSESVRKMLERLLAAEVERTLADEKALGEIATAAVGEFAAKGEITVAAASRFVNALRLRLAAEKNITVVTDDTIGTGFSVRLAGGRIEHDFTGDAVAAELARRLRPDLAALLK